MKPFFKRSFGQLLFISLFIMGLWLQPVYARGDLNSGWRLSAPPISIHRSHIGPRLLGRVGIRSRSMRSPRHHQKFHFRRGTSRLKNRSVRNGLYLFQDPFPYTPDTTALSNIIIVISPVEREPSAAQREENPEPYKTTPPLIIEERCGAFVKIPWPESGRLHEEEHPEQCHKSP
jgi:hypothetical protein